MAIERGRCRDCWWWYFDKCKRWPPQIIPRGTGFVSAWPTTGAKEWCGEYRSANEEIAARASTSRTTHVASLQEVPTEAAQSSVDCVCDVPQQNVFGGVEKKLARMAADEESAGQSVNVRN